MPATSRNVIQLKTAGPRQISPEQLQRWIRDPSPRSELDVLLTPDLARMLLKCNESGKTNRHMVRSHILAIRHAIASGSWENTGEPIIVSDEKLLNDGQYRCEAVVATNTPIVVDLRFGIKRHAFCWTNSGRHRGGGDALSILGLPNAHTVASVARVVVAYARGLPEAYLRPIGNGEIADAVARWPELPDTTRLTVGRQIPPFRNGMIGAIGFFAYRTGPRAQFEDFIATMFSGTGTASDPAHQWREYIVRNPMAIGSKTARLTVLALGIIAWNQYRRGDPAPLRFKPGAAFPEVEGLSL